MAHSDVPALEDSTMTGMYEAYAKRTRQAIFAFWCWIFGVATSSGEEKEKQEGQSP
jgi:hypothetical protein